MSKILRKCLSLGLTVMLLASLSLHGILTASADNKTGDGLAAYAMQAYNEDWVYSWGGASPGAVDCSGLIYSYVGGGERTTEGMLEASPESGYVSNGVPDIPGIGLWQPGHVGVYVGDGMAVDARDEISNICYQSVATKSWVMWFKVDGVSYDTDSSVTNDNQNEDSYSSDIQEDYSNNTSEYLSIGSYGSDVQTLQERLKELGYFDREVTGYFGSATEEALIEFQSDSGLTPDGIYDDETEYALMSDDAPVKLAEVESSAEFNNNILADNSEDNVNIPADDGDEIDSVNDNFEDTLQEEDLTQQNLDGQTSDEDEVSNKTDTYKNDETNTSNKTVFTYGDSGDGVSNVQYILTDLGYYHSNLTGEYDEKTFNSVEFFQLDNDLPATGSVDERTLTVLFTEFANKYSQTDNSINTTDDEEQSFETAVENKIEFENLISNSGDTTSDEKNSDTVSEIAESETAVSDAVIEEEIPDDTESTSTITEISDTNINTDSDTIAPTETTANANTDTDTKSTSSDTSAAVKSGGTNVAAGSTTITSNVPKSPKTGDPLAMSVQSAIDYIEDYVNTTVVLIVIGISCIVIFFAGTIHYWNVSMEKRRQRARKATTVSVYRRGSM